MQLDESAARNALSYVDAQDRDIWVRMGMAVKSEFGADGFGMWDDWSQSADNYKAAAAKSVWRSIKTSGRIGIGSLIHEAKNGGWSPDGTTDVSAIKAGAQRRRERREQDAKAEAESAARAAEAARLAAIMLLKATESEHPYLHGKGFSNTIGFVHENELLIPMRSHSSQALCGLQRIFWDGERWVKKMLLGMRASESVFKIGRGSEKWLVEGYATGLSVHAALSMMRISATVITCFSDSNLSKIAGLIQGRRFAFADNDASGAGEKAAVKAGIPYAIAPREDGVKSVDANDFHQSAGLFAVCRLIQEARKRNPVRGPIQPRVKRTDRHSPS